MTINKISALLLSLLFSVPLSAKTIDMEISYTEFMDKEDQAYLELYFALNGSSLDYAMKEGKGFIGGVEITVSLLQDSSIVAADKVRLLSPYLDDTSNVSNVFIQQLRLAVEPGMYTLAVDLQDINEPSENYHLEQSVETVLGNEKLAASELLFLESYEKSESPNVFSKSGYDLIPLVITGTPYFNESVNNLSFYTELYNTAGALGEGEAFVVKYYIRDTDANRVLNEYASFSKKTASEVEPILAGFSIADLRTGNYELVVEALNREGEVILSDSKFFYRRNAVQPVVSTDGVSEEELAGSFVQRLGNLDSIFLFIKYLNPISTERERIFQQNLLNQRDLVKMKRYFYAFWSQRNETDPAGQWKNYYARVRKANNQYGSSIRPGYMSDRGRVLLTYGEPDMVEARRMEPNMPPYEIWQYNQINTPYAPKQTNKMFIFAEFQSSTNEYELFHSTAIGEMQSRRWQYEMALKHRGNNAQSIDDNTMPGDGWGSRIRDNIIFDGTGSNRDRR